VLQLNQTRLRTWADTLGVEDLTVAEHDYRLVAVLEAIYSKDEVSKKLLMKGGTAINKLYLGNTARLSVDLDFNHIGERQNVLSERRAVRSALRDCLIQQDPSYRLSGKQNYNQTTIKAKYTSIIISPLRQLKLEISHIERIPILQPERRSATGLQKQFDVVTYALEELAATKVRALLERFKGRDIYDTYFILKLRHQKTLIRKLFLYYFYRSRKIYNPKIHFRGLRERLLNNRYDDDITGFVTPRVTFDIEEAAPSIVDGLTFLNDFDDDDETFLSLARRLLAKGNITKEMRTKISHIRYPLAQLFNGQPITERAAKADMKDIAVFAK
jgi:predicted nucleotidyltransferase component of viral defense system